MLNVCLIAVLMTLVVGTYHESGFTCYKCSYAVETEGTRRECIERPDRLGFGDRLQCNSTSYCVLQEVYDITHARVKSYFRSCSGNSWGNECNHYWTEVTCRSSCQGNYCNEHSNGTLHVTYIAKHKDGFNSAVHISAKWLTMLFVFVTSFVCVDCGFLIT